VRNHDQNGISRCDFVMIFDVQDGNPNGDPDAGNLPRADPESGHGLVTDVCLKRKIRNYVLTAKDGVAGFDVFVKEKAVLNQLIEKAYAELNIDLTSKEDADGKKREKGKAQGSEISAGRKKMCATYYDVRAFGAVMSTGPNAGQVRGPVQLTFARSVDPIVALEHSITRMAVATEEEAEKQAGDNRTMGRKATVPYGLYVGHGFVSPSLAAQTGFSAADLDLLWEAVGGMFEQDRSAARGLMTLRRLLVFQHESHLGNASAASLFEKVMIKTRDGVEAPRAYADYEVSISGAMPAGVSLLEWAGDRLAPPIEAALA
jgi:CRISPR-associated protein Csd2